MPPPDELVVSVLSEHGLETFHEYGENWLRIFRDLCALKLDERILEVGCGPGRVTIPLTRFLSPEGSYEGIDIIPEAIRWGTEEVTSRYPNFRFQLAEIFNQRYNPDGTLRASDYVFPFNDEEFDFALLTSVFTHMLPEDFEHYLSEIRRVLKKGGRFLASYVLLNDESIQAMADGTSVFAVHHDFGSYWTQTLENPEGLVGYREEFVLELYQKYQLEVWQPLYYGSWRGRAGEEPQDIIVASRA